MHPPNGAADQRQTDTRAELGGPVVRCNRLMAGAKRRAESGCSSAAPMARREASAPSAKLNGSDGPAARPGLAGFVLESGANVH